MSLLRKSFELTLFFLFNVICLKRYGMTELSPVVFQTEANCPVDRRISISHSDQKFDLKMIGIFFKTQLGLFIHMWKSKLWIQRETLLRLENQVKLWHEDMESCWVIGEMKNKPKKLFEMDGAY